MINNPEWYDDAECGKQKHRDKMEFFFSNKKYDQEQAKSLCFSCPVRKDCLKGALEEKQLYGVWGGLDQGEMRRALSINWEGQEMRRGKYPICAYCAAPTTKLKTKTVKRPAGGRWATMRVVECSSCKFQWQSRTSANAVDAYRAWLAERLAKAERDKIKNQKIREKNKAKQAAKDARAASKKKPT